jgi:hypothetical protein
MLSLVREQAERLGRPLSTSLPGRGNGPEILREGHVWYHEPRAAGPVWRGGEAKLDRRNGLTWKSPLDVRAAVALGRDEIRGVRLETGRSPGGSQVLVVETRGDPVRLAVDDVLAWGQAIVDLLESRAAAERYDGGG